MTAGKTAHKKKEEKFMGDMGNIPKERKGAAYAAGD